MENSKQTMALEPSTHTHTMTANKIQSTDIGGGTMVLTIEGDGIVTHGEHGTLKTESTHVVKSIQREYNPVTRAMQLAYD